MGSWQPRNFDQLLMMKLKINQNLFNNFFSKSVLSITQQHSPGRFVSLLFSLGYSTISRNYERNNMFLGRCKLSRPGSQWGEKGFHPFRKQISCSQVTREKKISERSELSGSSVFAPIPPPHYGAWSQANVNCRRVVVCWFFWGAFRAGREGEEGRDRRGHGSLGLSKKLLS